MQIRRRTDLEQRGCATATPMSVDEFLARFPEVPRDLRDEPTLQEYTRAFGPLLRLAEKPTPCMGAGADAQHVFYLRLVNDLAIYGIGLSKRERTLARLAKRLEDYRKQPATYACTPASEQRPPPRYSA